MPDLGAYAGAVLSAYAVTLVLLGGLILLTWCRSARIKATLAKIEARND